MTTIFFVFTNKSNLIITRDGSVRKEIIQKALPYGIYACVTIKNDLYL